MNCAAVIVLMSLAAQVPPDADVASTQPASLPAVPEHLAHDRGYVGKPNTGYLALPIPTPIEAAVWEWYCAFLQLSEAQVSALAEPFDRYRLEDWVFRVKNTQPLWDQSAELAARFPNQETVEKAQEMIRLYREADRVAPVRARFESAFFDEIALMLTESQLTRLEVVRMHRARKVNLFPGAPFPGYWFDLDAQLFAMSKSGLDVTPRDS